jgi:hypothetical protein
MALLLVRLVSFLPHSDLMTAARCSLFVRLTDWFLISTASAGPRGIRRAFSGTPGASFTRSRRRGSTWRLRLARPPRTKPRYSSTSWSSSPCSSPK